MQGFSRKPVLKTNSRQHDAVESSCALSLATIRRFISCRRRVGRRAMGVMGDYRWGAGRRRFMHRGGVGVPAELAFPGF